jgi:hypothetical protein
MHCKDCKFWGYVKAYGGAQASGVCGRTEWDSGSRPADDDAVMRVDAHDDSGLRAELRTGPEFGCLKFQKA